MKRFFAAAVLLLSLSACCGTKQNMPLEGTLWKLETMAGIPTEALSVEADFFTLAFNAADMMVAGRTNCNRFFGGYELKGSEVDFENMGMTRMACPDMQYEDLFVQMLDEVDRFEIKGDKLSFYDDAKLLAEFRAVPATPAK